MRRLRKLGEWIGDTLFIFIGRVLSRPMSALVAVIMGFGSAGWYAVSADIAGVSMYMGTVAMGAMLAYLIWRFLDDVFRH
jgi:hypothetical protein